MAVLQKPNSCDQNWLDMQPCENGRMCGACNKLIYDFTKMNWKEIERIQRANHNSVCGMYTDKQLKHWGSEIPKHDPKKLFTKAALVFSLTTTSALFSQGISKQENHKKTIISGTVKGPYIKDSLEVLVGVNISLANSTIGVVTDTDGKYSLDVTDYIDTIKDPTLVFTYVGFKPTEVKINKYLNEQTISPVLTIEENAIAHFYVGKPSLGKRIKWRFKRMFKRNR